MLFIKYSALSNNIISEISLKKNNNNCYNVDQSEEKALQFNIN